MRGRRVGIPKVLIGFLCVLLGFRMAHGASLPVPTPQPYYPQWWSTAVAGPLIQFQQDDTTAHQTILQLRKADGTIEVSFNIDGDGIIQGVLGLGNFTTSNLPTGKPVGSLAFDTTANAPKYLNNSSAWTAFPGSGTVTGTGTTNTYTKFTNGAGGVIGNAMEVDDGNKVSLLATPPSAANTALFNLGGAIAAGSSQGNYLGANSGNAFAGDFLDFEYSGTPKFVVDYNGNITDKGLTPNAIVYSSSGDVLSSAMVTSDLNLTTGTLGLTTQAGVSPGTYTNSTVTVNAKGIVTGVASGSISGISGSGTTNTLPKFTASAQLGNSDITDDGTTITNTKAVANQGSLTYQTASKTTTYTAANETTILCDASGGGFTVTLPAASASVGRLYQIIKTDSTGNTVTVAAAGMDKINGASTQATSSQYGVFELICGNSSNWYTPPGVASTLQQVMTAGNTSTVSSPMTLSPTTGAALIATTTDNHYAITADGTGLGQGITTGVTGDRVSADFERTYSGTSTAPLVNIHDNGQSVSTADLIKAIGNSNTAFFELDASGNATFSALGNASGNYLSVNSSGKLTDNTGTPLTSNPTLQAVTTAGATTTNDLTIHQAFPAADATYALGSNTLGWASVNARNFNVGNGVGPIGSIKNNGGVMDLASAATDLDIDTGGAGGYFINFLNLSTQSTIGANGAASALTANPVGYILFKISGTEYEIPYYNH